MSSRSVYSSKASKGFSKHIGPNTQLCLGFFVVFMSITPAILFTITLASPYYSVEQSDCDLSAIGNLTMWTVSNPMPTIVRYKEENLLECEWNLSECPNAKREDFSWLFEEHWTMWLHAGMCPNGKELDSGAPETKYCFPWKDDESPSIWEQSDLFNQHLIQSHIADIQYSDMEQGAKNFMQAWQMTCASCVFAWVLITVSVVMALHTDEHIELVLDKDVHSLDHETASPEELADHILHIDEKVDEHGAGDASYTKSVAAEFLVYLLMFGMATSILKLAEEGDFVRYPSSWQAFFPTCKVEVKPQGAIIILYYQCVTMGVYVVLLLCAELYYISEYITHCMHHYLTHPDEREHLKAHADSTGDDSAIPNTWKGPKFATRLHLLKVKAIKTVWYSIHMCVCRAETEHGKRFREAHEGSVRLHQHKDKLKKAHKAIAGHDNVDDTQRISMRKSEIQLGHTGPPVPPPYKAGKGGVAPVGFT